MAAETKKIAPIQGFEVIVGEVAEPIMDESVQYEGDCSQFPSAADCFRMMEDCPGESADLTDMMERLRKRHDKGADFQVSALSSTATTVSSSMASQWISHMKKSFKRRAMMLSEEQQGLMKKMVTEHGNGELAISDILMLYSRGLEAHHDGRYREMFERIRPCIPYFNTNVLVWIRVSEALIYEFYEETWEFADIYTRLFEHCPRRYMPSHQRRCNELRPRHPDMTMRFAETATLMTFALAKQSSRERVHYAASVLHGFLLLKMKRYTEAIDAIDFSVEKYEKAEPWQDEICILLTYKAEGMIGIGRYNRAIEYCLRVLSATTSTRTRHRATMLMAMAYMRKNNFKKAHEFVMSLLADGRLDEVMLENVTLLGLNLAHLMGNTEMFKRFELLLQRIVF